MTSRSTPRLDAIEATLADLIPRLSPAPTPHGRPEVLPGALLWTGLLVCITRQLSSQHGLWRLLSQQGLWHHPRVPVGAEAVRIRLERTGPDIMETLFHQTSAEVAVPLKKAEQQLAPFATGGVYALDESTFDGVARTLEPLRDVPAGDDQLLPGKLITAFDIRRQQFHTVQTTDVPRQNEKVAARDVLATLPKQSLVLTDLGYFSFEWFDDVTESGHGYVSRLRSKVRTETAHVLSEQDGVRDELAWLGVHRADRAGHLIRRIQVTRGKQTRVYITNVLEPDQVAVAEVVRLYARRWDVEMAFKLVKRELGLHVLWSAKWELILTQLWGVLLIAQIALSLRAQIAQRANVDLFEVSLSLLLRELPYLVRDGDGDVIGHIAALPKVKGGFLRPSRRTQHEVPEKLEVTPPPDGLVRKRKARYAGRRAGPTRDENRPRTREM